MARRRVTVPSIAKFKEMEGLGTTRLERELVSRSARQPVQAGLGARERAQRAMTYDLALAMQAAKEGDDTELLPYQPTPSINPPRPRTLAAGYDPESKVMRVRFRDGAIYGYANVSPREWTNFKRVRSPGRSINRTFNHKDYWRETGFEG